MFGIYECFELKINEITFSRLKNLKLECFFDYNVFIVRKLKGEMKKWINFLN